MSLYDQMHLFFVGIFADIFWWVPVCRWQPPSWRGVHEVAQRHGAALQPCFERLGRVEIEIGETLSIPFSHNRSGTSPYCKLTCLGTCVHACAGCTFKPIQTYRVCWVCHLGVSCVSSSICELKVNLLEMRGESMALCSKKLFSCTVFFGWKLVRWNRFPVFSVCQSTSNPLDGLGNFILFICFGVWSIWMC